jgi:hypothetical protein
MFTPTEKELEVAKSWIEQHKKDHVMKYEGVSGGRWTWLFTPTTIGCVVRIRCTCGEEKDVSNYGMW